MSKKIKLKDLLKENFSSALAGGVVSRNAFGDSMSLSNIVKEKYGEVRNTLVEVENCDDEDVVIRLDAGDFITDLGIQS